MNNTEFVSALNEYSFSGENDKILKILNALFDSGEYKAYPQRKKAKVCVTGKCGQIDPLSGQTVRS